MADDIKICNLALGRIGANKITSLDESSQAARYCKLYFAQTRDEVLQAALWPFATTRATLSRLADNPAFGWAYQYQLPVDFIAVRQLNSWEVSEARDFYEIEGDHLLTDAETAELRYVYRIADSSSFPPTFVEALEIKLASKLAVPLTGSNSNATNLLTEFERVTKPIAIQAARDGRPKRKQPWIESDFVRARFGV